MQQIMIARNFLQGHPRAGESTRFVEKIWQSIYLEKIGWNDFYKLSLEHDFDVIPNGIYPPKHHTIRSGKRFKTGDQVVLKVWSGKPYRSKTITITPPLTLTVYNIKIDGHNLFIEDKLSKVADYLCVNDGLSKQDFIDWFEINSPKFKGFDGQILVWGNVTY